MKYFAKTSEQEYVIDVRNSDDGTSVLLGDRPVEVELKKIDTQSFFSMLLDGRSYQIFVERRDGDYEVTVNGRKHIVALEDEKSRMVRKVIKADAGSQGAVELKSPMPGLVVKVNVEEGQEVERNDSLLIIEAMKMENEIRATSSGVVKKIFKKDGDSVEKDAVLMVIE